MRSAGWELGEYRKYKQSTGIHLITIFFFASLLVLPTSTIQPKKNDLFVVLDGVFFSLFFSIRSIIETGHGH